MFRFVQRKSNLILGQHAFFPMQPTTIIKKLYSSNAKTFESIKMISPTTIKALNQEFKYKEMTSVQEKVLELLPTDNDLLVKAKTGTGKTLAFLIAALESALARRNGIVNGKKTLIMIISPTRELALQIAQEARRLVKLHNLKVGVAVGGTSRFMCIQNIENFRLDLLVGTPGRIIDVLNSSEKARQKVDSLDTIILDEADRLLEMGFKEDIEHISSFLPEKKQSFLFSATIPQDVKAIAQKLLLPGHKFIDTVPENEEPTHLTVKQTFMISPHSKQLFLLHQIIRKHMEEQKGGKIIVFFPTTKLVELMTNIFSRLRGIDIIEMHSQLSQNMRERKSERFRKSTSSIMFTSDVSARGVDYPGVTLVVQMGAPSNRDSYIHRVGRTGRAGKEGEGILILSSFEENFMQQISDIPIKEDYRFETPPEKEIVDQFKDIISSFPTSDRMSSCYAMMNYFSFGCNLKLSGESILAASRDFARGILGLDGLPPLSAQMTARLSSGKGKYNKPRSNYSSSLYSTYQDRVNSDSRDFKGSNYARGGFGGDRKTPDFKGSNYARGGFGGDRKTPDFKGSNYARGGFGGDRKTHEYKE